MRKLIVDQWLSLDKVLQGPSSADEDTDGGFQHGGWHLPYFDDLSPGQAGGGRGWNRMRIRINDLVATILVGAIAVPYIGYLINGEMPFVQDPRGMSATGLVLGVLAFQVLRRGDTFDRLGKVEIGLGLVSLALGFVALILAETAAAEILLAVFMGSILVVWAVELMDHVGILHGAHSAAPRHP